MKKNNGGKLKVNNIIIGTIGEVVTHRIDISDFNPGDIKTVKTALLYPKNDFLNTYYVDIETGLKVNTNINDLEKGEYFVNFSKGVISFSELLKCKEIIYNNNEITRNDAIKLFNLSQKGIERTLAIVKPDGIKHIDKIIEMFYKNGLKIDSYKVTKLKEELINEHYSHLLDKPFFPKLKEYMKSGEVAIMILEGENAVEKLRNLMGPTDSAQAESNTIRGKFGTDKTYNAIHGSDSIENAEIEIKRFFNQKQKRI